MLKVKEFDIKTGKHLTNYDPATNSQMPRTKNVENSYLEQWLQRQRISEADSQLSVAQFYDGVNEADVKNLLDRGQELVFTSGKFGYFANPKLAKLLLESDPIYDNGKNIAHNVVAYGSLMISDGVVQTITDQGKARVLLVDNIHRSVGDKRLLDRKGKPFTDGEVDTLLNVMGDGTMLIPSATMAQLLVPDEISTAIETGLTQAKVEPHPELVETLINEYHSQGSIRLSNVNLITAKAIQTELARKIERSVIQFRAALTDVPGIAKGTAKTSDWCRKLGVDAIISLDDVKGAKPGGVFDRPGLVELDSDLWINRKDIARYGDQTVGAQVKYKIPKATLSEFNPRALAQAQKLALVAKDPYRMAQRQVAKVEQRRQRPLFIDNPAGTPEERELDLVKQIENLKNDEALALVLQSDRYGQIVQMPNIRNQLARSIRADWLDVATAGIEIPSAMAQHHAALQPWEICNQDLPAGAIVAYYRSPFGNVGAAAIAINHLDVIAKSDPESYNKEGVSYLPPWTSKNIAITDFDSDRNGYFVGFVAKDPQTTIQGLRDRLAGISDPALQYEAGRHEIDLLIQQGTELTPGEYPDAVTEFIAANRPEHQPMPIPKDQKIRHPRLPDQHLSISIAQAWIKTAQNPVGLVANRSMILESLAQHITYTEGKPERTKLQQAVMSGFRKIKPQEIPTNQHLEQSGLPPLNLAARIQSVLKSTGNNTEQALQETVSILEDYAKYPMAKNLQTAVDIQKSNQGIDQALSDFGSKLSYQKHDLRNTIKSSESYTTKQLGNNTVDPVGQQVAAVNHLFANGVKLALGRDSENRAFRSIIPNIHKGRKTEIDLAVRLISSYDSMTNKLDQVDQKLRLQDSIYRQPSLSITSTTTGKSLRIDRLADAQALNPVNLLELDGKQANFVVVANPHCGIDGNKQDQLHPYLLKNADRTQTIGFIQTASLLEIFKVDPITSALSTEQIDTQAYKILDGIDKRISAGRVQRIGGTIKTIPPFVLQNDRDQLYNQMNTIRDYAKQQVKGQEAVMLSAFNHTSTGQGLSLKVFPREVIKHLDKVEKFEVFGATNLTSHQDAIVRIDNVIMTEKCTNDLKNTPIASLVNDDGTYEVLGQIDQHVAPMAPGTLVKVNIQPQLDPSIRIEIPGMKLIGVKDPTIDHEIPAQTGKFAFKREQGEISAYLLGDNGETTKLGSLNTTAKIQLASNSLSEPMEGTYRRGLYQGTKNASQKLYLQVTELVEHQPVQQEQITAQANFDDSITITSAPFEYRQATVSTSTNQAQGSASRSDTPPANDRQPEISISLNERQQFERSVGDREIEARANSPNIFVPSRSEIIEWLQATDPHSSDSQQIWSLGLQLKRVYLAQGHHDLGQIPNSYKHDSVSISADEKQRFDQIVQASREKSDSRQLSRSF